MLHICAESDGRFKWKSQLNNHVLDRHTNEKKFQCTLCVRTFKYHSWLKSHIKIMHGSTRNFQCIVCQATFKNLCTLKITRSLSFNMYVPYVKKSFFCRNLS